MSVLVKLENAEQVTLASGKKVCILPKAEVDCTIDCETYGNTKRYGIENIDVNNLTFNIYAENCNNDEDDVDITNTLSKEEYQDAYEYAVCLIHDFIYDNEERYIEIFS